MIEKVPPHLIKIREIPPNPYIEIITILIIIGVSFYIFFKTKEIYELTKHRGINYFRKAFLFYGLSATSAIILSIIRFFFDIRLFRGGFFISAGLMLIAVLYAFFSLFHKEFKQEKYIYIITLTIVTITFLSHHKIIAPLFISIIFLSIGITSFIKYKKKRKSKKTFSHIYTIYLALFGFWLLNTIRFQLEIYFDLTGSAISIFSAAIFLYILHIFKKRFSNQ